MTATRIDGKAFAANLRARVAARVAELKAARGVTLHGAALNLDERAERGFDAIDPCGLVGVRVTSIAAESGRAAPSCAEAARVLAEALARRLGIRACRRADLAALAASSEVGTRSGDAPEEPPMPRMRS